MGVGYRLYRYALEVNELASYLSAKTAAAVDVRMSGALYPIMSVAGSGNHGIISTVPLAAYSEKTDNDRDLLVRSVTLSMLLTIYSTYYVGYLSPACGCATKAGVGITAGLAYYMSNGDADAVKRSIKNFVAGIPGVICDGAKATCAIKLAAITCSAFQSALTANMNMTAPNFGIVGKTPEESIKNMAKTISAMKNIDAVIIDQILKNHENVKIES